MKNILIIYGSTTGNTRIAVDEIDKEIKKIYQEKKKKKDTHIPPINIDIHR